MVIDTSAIAAIAFNEPEAETFERKVVDAPRRFISAATILELTIVIEARLSEVGAAELDVWLYKAGVEIVAVDADQIAVAKAWLAPLRQRPAFGGTELWRLLLLCAGQDACSLRSLPRRSFRSFEAAPPRVCFGLGRLGYPFP
jgi:hypothetical protein